MSQNTSEKSYKQISDFIRLASARIKNSNLLLENKLIECIYELAGNPDTGELGNLFFVSEKFTKEKKKIQRRYAAVDEKGYLLKDQHNNYIFTKENDVLCDDELEDLLNAKISFEPCYCPVEDLPDDLLPAEKIIYKGFIIEDV